MSRTAAPFSQIRSLGQLKNLVFETLDTLSKIVSVKSNDAPNNKSKNNLNDSTTLSSELTNDPSKTSQSLTEFVKERENELEKALADWADSGNERKSPPSSPEKKLDIKTVTTTQLSGKGPLSKATVENHSRFLVKSLAASKSPVSQLLRLEEICKHLLKYPEAKGILVQDHAIRLVLQLRQYSKDTSVKAQSREVLALLGYTDPPSSSGVRILSIDGGGIRGIMAVEMLRQLEKQTGKRIYELFDLICGVSTGAILGVLFAGLNMSLDDCEVLYRKMSCDIFNQNPWLGTGRLVWNHAYYDTKYWVDMLRKAYGECGITEINRKNNAPKLAVFSAIMNLPTLQAYMFRSYALPYRSQSNYIGGCNHKAWEAIRASAAAPGYFEDYCIDGLIHQDGGLLWNNPTGLAIHEAKLLWPKERISCVVSLGTGRYIPLPDNTGATSTNLKTKILKILDSATDTEGVHSLLHDLLPPNVYFRFNPYLTDFVTMDEIRPEKLNQLKIDAQLYIRKNEHKISEAAKTLVKPRGTFQKVVDYAKLQKELKL